MNASVMVFMTSGAAFLVLCEAERMGAVF
jgi:hypothetical protein